MTAATSYPCGAAVAPSPRRLPPKPGGAARQVGARGRRIPAHAEADAYWISDDVVYTLDYVRGIDILRFDAKATPSDSGHGAWHSVSPFQTHLDREPVRAGAAYVCPLPV